MTKRKDIRILFIEDMPADVALAHHELRKGGLDFRSKRVESREDYLHELEHNPPDLILSDHGLPSFDGFTALAIARDKCPEVPFIFVTGAHGEQMAIEAFESGATGYVLKNQLARLVPAVQRALRGSQAQALLQQKERAVQEGEERFRMLVDGVKDYAIIMLDAKGCVTSWNAGAEWIHGYGAEEILGQSFARLYEREDQERGLPELALKTAAGEGRFEESRWRVRKGGDRFQANVVVTALRDETGRLRGFAQVTRDVTAQKQAEEALRKSEALKGAILETALDAIISIDQEGLVQEWNPAARKIFGYTRSAALGRAMDELIVPPALREVYRDGLSDYLMTGVGSLLGRPVELTLRRADGTEFRAELAITRVPTEEPPRCTALVRDITERKQAEAALRQSEERLRLMVENVKEYAIYMLDADGRVATWNTGAERINGYRADEIIGRPLATFFTAEDAQKGVPELTLNQAREEGQARYEGWRVRKDGSRFWAEGIITALRDDAGNLSGFSKVTHDMTERKRAEEVIWDLNTQLERRVLERTAQLEAANNDLEAFSYSIAHDLRAPLRHVVSYIEILQHETASKLSRESQGHLNRAAQAARRLDHLINALLAFSRMSRTEMREQRVALATLVEEARHDLQHDIDGRNIDWQIGPLPEVDGDPIMLRQVIMNLLSNALKYTRPRTPARIEIGALDANLEMVFFIRDNGVGFDMKYADKLFRVFQRLHPVSEFEGTGIGLANVRAIIRRHGGRVWAEGSVNGGATFYFSLPVLLKGTARTNQ